MAEERIVPINVGEHNRIEYEEHIARYRFATDFIKEKCVGLDIACGSGYGTDMLLCGTRASKFIGVDISKDAITYAREHYKDTRLEFIHLDAAEIAFSKDQFDLVTSFETIEHLDKDRGKIFLDKLIFSLKKEGILILSCPNRDTYPNNYVKNPYHIYEYFFIEIEMLLRKYFRKVDIYCQKMRYFNKFYKKTTQLMKRLPRRMVLFLAEKAKKRFIHDRNLKNLNIFSRILLYQYYFNANVFSFVEKYSDFKPVFAILVCKDKITQPVSAYN